MPFNIPFKPWYLGSLSNFQFNSSPSFYKNEENKNKAFEDIPQMPIKATRNISNNTTENEPIFEIFGLKLFFDDILIICVLLFLYSEKVKNEELFICLILLLLN